MYKQTFAKTSIPVEKQIELLQQRGLRIDDLIKAKHRLNTVSYYRLSAYFKSFQISKENHNFKPNTCFDDIWHLYVFDRELRLQVLDVLERIEITLRTALSNKMSEKYGTLWYLSKQPFAAKWSSHKNSKSNTPYTHLKKDIEDICCRKKEDFIKHYYDKYNEPIYPPSWMIIECLSFGKCTSLFRNIATLEDKKAICQIFGYHPRVIESTLEAMRYTRNVCAHHARLWNRWFVYTPKHLNAFGEFKTKPRSLHEQLFIIGKLLQTISPNSLWKTRLYKLFEKYEQFPGPAMGFTNNWREDPFWEL
ncbi:MAG: Abi family protein [Gammaproteobacteria bacterium]|nr:Abi family protein [Gammaproteobacteria bacterium]